MLKKKYEKDTNKMKKKVIAVFIYQGEKSQLMQLAHGHWKVRENWYVYEHHSMQTYSSSNPKLNYEPEIDHHVSWRQHILFKHAKDIEHIVRNSGTGERKTWGSIFCPSWAGKFKRIWFCCRISSHTRAVLQAAGKG